VVNKDFQYLRAVSAAVAAAVDNGETDDASPADKTTLLCISTHIGALFMYDAIRRDNDAA